MAITLHDRAVGARTRYLTQADETRRLLGEVRSRRDKQHPDPPSVASGDWAEQLGSAQHLRVAREALAAVDAAIAQARTGLSTVATPAEAGAGGAALAHLLVERGRLTVAKRYAEDRLGTDQALIVSLTGLLGQAESAVAAADAHLAWAKTRQDAGNALLDALDAPPLDTLKADAESVRTGAELTAADDHLDTLLPSQLRARAEARIGEARKVDTDAGLQREKAESTLSDRDELSHKIDAEVTAALAAFEDAQAALEVHVARAPGRLASARDALVAVSSHPPLTAAQAAALDAGSRPEAVDAVTKETALVVAMDDLVAAQVGVDDAVLTALDADPDADPGQDDDVKAAAQARQAVVDGPLKAAHDAYDDAAREALDRWEVEVPPSVWEALQAFVVARSTVEELATRNVGDDLKTGLAQTAGALEKELDDRDRQHRGDLVVARVLAERTAVERAAAASATARAAAYLRGDGPSGRTPAELAEQ